MVIIRNPSDYTHTSSNKSESMIINSDDSEFQKYFGFKLGEKVDVASHFGRVSSQPERKKQKKEKKRMKNMTFEERIAYK